MLHINVVINLQLSKQGIRWPVSTDGIAGSECSLFTFTAEADRGLCQLVMFLTVFFYWMYKMKFIQLLSGVFCYSWLVFFIGFLVEKSFACQSRKSNFRCHSYGFSPYLIRERVESEAILALLDSFHELHREW